MTSEPLPQTTEQRLLDLWRQLPLDRQQQVFDFLRFLAYQLGLSPLLEPSTPENPPAEQSEIDTGLSQFIGAGKGCFSSPEEATQFIRQERDAWHF
jgi:hypothetical protein